MGKNTSVSLHENNLEFIHQQVELGRYGSTSEVIRAGLRMLEEREIKLEKLRQELQKGLDSGPSRPFDFDEFLAEMHTEHEGKDAA